MYTNCRKFIRYLFLSTYDNRHTIIFVVSSTIISTYDNNNVMPFVITNYVLLFVTCFVNYTKNKIYFVVVSSTIVCTCDNYKNNLNVNFRPPK